jgi:hypothetical protein
MRKRAMVAAGLLAVCALMTGCTGSSGVNTQTLDPVSTSTPPSSSSTEASPSQITASGPSPAGSSVTSGTDGGLSAGEAAESCGGRSAVDEILGGLSGAGGCRRDRVLSS